MAKEADLPARFASAFDALAERLDAMLPARLHEEADAGVARAIKRSWPFRVGSRCWPLFSRQRSARSRLNRRALRRPPRLRGFLFQLRATKRRAPQIRSRRPFLARFGLLVAAAGNASARRDGGKFFPQASVHRRHHPRAEISSLPVLEAENELGALPDRALAAIAAAVAALALVALLAARLFRSVAPAGSRAQTMPSGRL